jgi:hypothetical protein
VLDRVERRGAAEDCQQDLPRSVPSRDRLW